MKTDCSMPAIYQPWSHICRSIVPYILSRKYRSVYKSFISISEFMMSLLCYTNSFQNVNSFFNRWFKHFYYLKYFVQGGIILLVHTILVQCGDTNALYTMSLILLLWQLQLNLLGQETKRFTVKSNRLQQREIIFTLFLIPRILVILHLAKSELVEVVYLRICQLCTK